MSDIVSPLLQWLNAHPQLAGLVTFLISAGESVAILGTIVPGSIMMTALGTLAGAGVIPLGPTICWAILGAIVGDGISYWLGHYFKDRLPQLWPFRTHPSLLRTGEIFFHKYGSMSVFIGRFVGPVRALVPVVAGMLGMKPLQFTIANVTSAILWAPAYMLPGILLGAASLELPPDIAIHVMLVLLLILLFILLCLWFVYKLLQLIHNQTTQMQNMIWQRLQHSRHLSSATYLLKHYNPTKTHGQLNLAFYFLLSTILFIVLVIYVKSVGAANIAVNQALFHLFRGVRSPLLDNWMINIILLGQKEVVLPAVLVLFAALCFWKRWRAATHTLLLGVFATLSVFVLKRLIQSPRPWGIFLGPESFSMPSGHATLSMTIYFGLAFLISTSIRPRFRWPLYFTAGLVTLAVSVGRLYLGAHWFTDIISAWLLSASLLLLIIISYNRYREKVLHPLSILLPFLITLCLTFSVYHHRHFDQLQKNYAQINWPTAEIRLKDWWQRDGALYAYHTSLFGFQSQPINIQWVGDLGQIRASLLNEGWTKPPARDWISTLHRLSDVRSYQYLPMVSPQYLDKNPALTLIYLTKDGKKVLVLRLWESNRKIQETNTSIWVGFIGYVPRTYSWLFKNRPHTVTIHPDFLFANRSTLAQWEWKLMMINPPAPLRKTALPQKMMLIRPRPSISEHR